MDSSNQKLLEPRQALDEAGAQTQVVSPVDGKVKGWNHTDWGDEVPVELLLNSADPSGYDALAWRRGSCEGCQDALLRRATAAFCKHFLDAGEPLTAICHGPRTVIEIEAARGCTLTSWPSLKTDIRNAGGTWVDKDVATDKRVSNRSQTG